MQYMNCPVCETMNKEWIRKHGYGRSSIPLIDDCKEHMIQNQKYRSVYPMGFHSINNYPFVSPQWSRHLMASQPQRDLTSINTRIRFK